MRHVTGFIAFMANAARYALGIIAAMLPARWWRWLDRYVPASDCAHISGILTLLAAAFIGLFGFLAYARQLSSDNLDAGWTVAQQNPQHDDKIGIFLRSGPMAFTAFALPLFLFTTPLGLLSFYMAVSGVLRSIAPLFDDAAFGDPLLTGIDKLATGGARRSRARAEQMQRQKLAGPALPDRIMSASQLGIDHADFVIVSSRPKPDWSTGTVVLTAEGAYRVGAIEDRMIAGRLRTLYALTEHKDLEAFRRVVHYELPPGRRT